MQRPGALVLDKGAEVNRADKDDETPLHVACRRCGRLLLENGEEVDRADEDGRTPSRIACQQGHVDAVRLLLEKGAAVDRADTQGRTPNNFWTQQRNAVMTQSSRSIEDHRYKADIDATPYPPERRGKIWLGMMACGKKRALRRTRRRRSSGPLSASPGLRESAMTTRASASS